MTDPELQLEQEERLALLLADLADRTQRGEEVDIEAACQEHPDLADELRQLWGMVVVTHVAGASSTPTSGSQGDLPIHALPRRIGDYELLEEIGRGGMGVVYRARQFSLNREVAIKMILRGQLATEADRARFRAEAEAAAQLDHPAIVPVYEVGELDGEPFFSMKYFKGKTLAQRLAEGPMPPREAAEILREVARAVHFAHRQGVLHRDLKPSNILLDDHNAPHVTDFGLAKRSSDPTGLTKTGAILGTPEHMSPEQAGGRPVGPASDVYSLGSILYQMLTGRPAFLAKNPAEAIMMIIEQEPPSARSINAQADRELEMIAIRCLQKPADLRYGTAEELARDLNAYLNDEPIAAREGRLGQVVAGWFRDTHHASVLENWGLLWMWHSLVLFLACMVTHVIHNYFEEKRWIYVSVWTAGFWLWAAVFWALRRRMGPVTFVERQIAHLWAGSAMIVAALFPLERSLGLAPLQLSPILALISAMVFIVKAGILSGSFYVQAFALLLTTIPMVRYSDSAHLIFGVVCATCFFLPGLKYYRQKNRNL